MESCAYTGSLATISEIDDQVLQAPLARCGYDSLVGILVVRTKFDSHRPGTNQFSEAGASFAF
jgi:hypothetical protein